MTQPVLQSASRTSFRLFLGFQGTWYRIVWKWDGFSLFFSHFFENRVRSRGERGPSVPAVPLPSWSAAAGWALTREVFLTGLSRNLDFSQKTPPHGCLVCTKPQSAQVVSARQAKWCKTQDKMRANHYFLLLKKEQQVKATALLCPLLCHTLLRHLPPPS